MMTLLIWWTNQEDCEALSEETVGRIGSKSLPDYLMHELRARYGRNGRGRLWAAKRFMPVEVNPWPSTPLANVLGAYYGGIVFDAADLPALAEAPGIITDMRLKRIGG